MNRTLARTPARDGYWVPVVCGLYEETQVSLLLHEDRERRGVGRPSNSLRPIASVSR